MEKRKVIILQRSTTSPSSVKPAATTLFTSQLFFFFFFSRNAGYQQLQAKSGAHFLKKNPVFVVLNTQRKENTGSTKSRLKDPQGCCYLSLLWFSTFKSFLGELILNIKSRSTCAKISNAEQIQLNHLTNTR